MNKERIETGKAPHIQIECSGDLIVRGWDESAVRVRGDFEVEQSEKGLRIESNDNLRLDVPHTASLHVASQGNTIVKGVEGEVMIDETMGDLIAKSLGSLTVHKAHGNVVAKNVDGEAYVEEAMGDVLVKNLNNFRSSRIHGNIRAQNLGGWLEVGEAMGDLVLRNVSGDVKVERGQGNASISNVGGHLELEEIMGDITLRGGLTNGEHSCHAHGNIIVRWPIDAPLNVTATAPQIVSRLPLEAVERTNGEYRGSLGNGDVNLTLYAKGDIVLKSGVPYEGADTKAEDFDFDFDYDYDFDFNTLGDRISSQINERMAELTTHIESRFGPEFASKMAEKATRKAERAVERAMRQVERHRRHAERGAYRSAWAPPPPPKPSKKTTAEEQLQILQMLEKGIISTEEANMLLEALES